MAKLLLVGGLFLFLALVTFFERYPKLLSYFTYIFLTATTALVTLNLILS